MAIMGNESQSKSPNIPSSTGASLERFSRDTGKQLGAMTSRFTDSASEYVRTGREYVKENPATGVAVAAAAGVLAGSLLTMALRKRH